MIRTISTSRRECPSRLPAHAAICAALALVAGGPLQALGPDGSGPRQAGEQAKSRPPNVVFVLADDLGYGDLGVYGQRLIKTPHIDRLAADGMRFTQFYAGSTVCAPSRAVLMTGRHMGHVSVRGNAGRQNPAIQTLRQGERTIAHVMKDAGYRTGLFGKWGLGEVGSSGHPNRMGFDEFFGYLNQSHAHNYYPSFLYRNSDRVPLENVPEVEDKERGDGWAKKKIQYSHDLIMDEAMQWLEKQRGSPFFLYLSVTIPHANNEATRGTGDGQEVPDYGIYANEQWPNPDKGQAAMITRLDRDVGRLMAKLEEWGVARDTIVIFTSDNGPHQEGGNNPDLFDPNGPLRGMKRALYEGGIRVPFIVRWPARVAAGSVSSFVGYFGDMYATFSDIVGKPVPGKLDSISILPTLAGNPDAQKQHDYLYWEFYEQGSRQAVRMGDFKAIREPMFTGPVQIYDLSADIGETKDLAASRPDLVARAVKFMEEAHTPDPNWKIGVKSAAAAAPSTRAPRAGAGRPRP